MNVPAAALPSDALRRRETNLVDAAWDVLASVRFELVLVGLFAGACALGTFVNPGNHSLGELRATIGHEWWYPLYRFFELDSLFHSWWFVLLVVLLALSVAAGAIERFPNRRDARLGPWIAQLGVLLVLGGALLGRWLGVEGVANVPMDGGTFDYVMRRSGQGSPFKESLGFTVRVESFKLLKYDNGSLRTFESEVDILDALGKPSVHKTLTVGDPLTYAGWTFYQSSFEEDPGREQAKLAITDLAAGSAAKTFVLSKDADAAMPDGVHFKVINYTADFQHLGPAVQIARSAPDGTKTSFWVFESYPEFDAKNRGDKYGLRFGGLEPFYFTGLRVARDPGYPLWLSGCCVMLLGLAVTYVQKARV
jgi:cytochrome c biogenesis protein ResB